MIYDFVTINGSELTNVYDISVTKAISDDDISSNFSIALDNLNGKFANNFNVGDEINIYVGSSIVDGTDSGTRIFAGILEDIKYPSNPQNNKLTLNGRDYTARLMDVTVEPEVYNNLPAGSIIKDIITKYVSDITISGVQDSTTTIERISFNHTPVYDAINKLAEIANYSFYVDNYKDLHFQPISYTDSGYTLNSENILSSNISEKRDEIFNEIWIYGDRYLDSFKQEFTAGSPVGGSVFTLLYNPHNTIVSVGSPIQSSVRQKGGIENMGYTSGVNYLVNFNDKTIIFVSGTDIGYSSIPASGAMVTIDYQRELPIVKVGKDNDSIANYGKRVKVINDKEIKDPLTAETYLITELAKYSEPKKSGTLKLKGYYNINPSQTCIVDMPYQDVNSQTYDVIEVNYDFNKENNMSEQVMNIKVNNRNEEITDTIKQMMLDIRKLQAQDISDTDILTRFEFTTGSFSVRHNGTTVYTRSIAGEGLVWNSPSFGLWGTGKWSDSLSYSFILGNPLAAVLGTSALGTNTSDWVAVWSGNYV